jgi:hypothetical protein
MMRARSGGFAHQQMKSRGNCISRVVKVPIHACAVRLYKKAMLVGSPPPHRALSAVLHAGRQQL